jgi:hypothetical protein
LDPEPTVSYSAGIESVSGIGAPPGEPDHLLPPPDEGTTDFRPKKRKVVGKPQGKRAVRLPKSGTLTRDEYLAASAELGTEPPPRYGSVTDSVPRHTDTSREVRSTREGLIRSRKGPLIPRSGPEPIPVDYDNPVGLIPADLVPADAQYEVLARTDQDEDLDDRALWERQAGLPANWYEEEEVRRRTVDDLTALFFARFRKLPPETFHDDDDLALYMEWRLEQADAALLDVELCSNCHELPATTKRRQECEPCDKYRRRNGQARPARLFNSHRRTPIGERRTGS